MGKHNICITTVDMQRLRKLISHPDLTPLRPRLERLERELNRATVVHTVEAPEDVVTMNSRVRLVDVHTGAEWVVTLVYPSDEYIPEGKISVVSPLGIALLGCRQGDTVEWDAPSGHRSFKVDCILYQPEAAGEYAL